MVPSSTGPGKVSTGRYAGSVFGPPGLEVEQGAVARALDGAALGVERPSASGPSSCEQRSSIAYRVAAGVEDADLAAAGLDDALLPGRQLVRPADLDCRLSVPLSCIIRLRK